MAKRTRDPVSLDLTQEELDAIYRNNFAAFVRLVFEILKPNEKLLWAPYIDIICSELEEVVFGRAKRKIINVPPRFLKSIVGSVALPAFFLGHNPSADVMCVSYAADIAKAFGEDTLKVMTSPDYKRIFDVRLKSERTQPGLLRTTEGGVRRATSIDGQATGLGANLTIFDDPQKAEEALSDAVRTSTNRAFENTFLSRANNPTDQRIVIIMQRLHEDDFVGHVLSRGADWGVVRLPAIAEHDETWTYNTLLGPRTWTRKEGESLHPERFPIEAMEARRREVNESIWATQYQQRPTPAGGGLVKREWFRQLPHNQMPTGYELIVQSWDTAVKTEQWNDYSVCTTWGIKDGKAYLINVYRERHFYPDLRDAVLQQAAMFKANHVLIEDKSSGEALLQDLPRIGFDRAVKIEPEHNKEMRMAAQTAPLANGFIFVPAEAPWLQTFLAEMEAFPNSRFDDQVDSTSQFLKWRNNFGMQGWNVYEFYRRKAEESTLSKPRSFGDEVWTFQVPESQRGIVFNVEGTDHRPDADGLIHIPKAYGPGFATRPGFRRIR